MKTVTIDGVDYEISDALAEDIATEYRPVFKCSIKPDDYLEVIDMDEVSGAELRITDGDRHASVCLRLKQLRALVEYCEHNGLA